MINTTRPRIVVLGGGIFGTSTAASWPSAVRGSP